MMQVADNRLVPVGASASARVPAPPEAEEEVLDLAAAVGELRGDAALLAEVAALFLEQCRATVAETDAAAERGDAAALERSAHRLKGAAAQVGARALARAALDLETLGREGDLGPVAEARATLAAEVARIEAALASPARDAADPAAIHPSGRAECES